MSILSTNQKLINIGKDYSAGSGIDITDQVISVIGNTVPYSAGENIDIQDFVISGKDWSNDITDASANAFNETTAWVHDNYTNSADVSFLSAEVDKKLDSSAWEAISGSLATEDYVILSDNLTYARATAFTTAQEYAKESACNSAFAYLNQNKLDVSAFDLPSSGHWNEATNVVESNSAAWFDNVGDAEVNSFVYTNSSTIIDVDSTYQANSASYLTAHQDISNKLDTTAFSTVSGDFLTAINIPESANWNDTTNVVQTNSADWASHQDLSYISGVVDNKLDESAFANVSGTFLTAHQSLDGYATEDWITAQGYITGVDLSEYAKTSSVLDYIDSACSSKLDTTSFSNVSGDFLTTSFGISESAHWEEATNAYEQASGTYLTSHQDLSDYQTIEGMTAYQPVGDYYSASNPSGFITGVDLTPYYTTADANTLSSMLSGAIDYVSANVGEGGVISSFTSAWSHLVPPYGDYVINSLNGKYVSSYVSNSADRAVLANSANWASSAGYAYTVNVTNVENLGFVRNLSSEYGTIYVIHNNLIESTNSAILRTGYEGFVSSFGGKSIGPYGSTATFSWGKSLPDTTFNFTTNYPPSNTIITYSADTNLTGEISLTGDIETFNISVPNATAISIWSNTWTQIIDNVASAADTFETVVGELAWASALPTFEYDNTNKISAINGSALAGGSEFPASANEAITAYQNASGTYLTAISIPESATWNDVSTTVLTNSSNWDNVTNKLDTTSFSTVSGDFLTAVDLTPYQTIEGMTAYQPVGDYATTGDLALKQDTLNFGYDEQDRINSINSSALAGGVDVTSPLGTISVDGSNIEATNSAVGPIITPAASALLGDGISINGTLERPTLFNFTLPTSGGTLYAVRTMFDLTNRTFNFSGKDLNGNIATGTMTYPGEIGTYTADLGEIVSNISAQNNELGPVYVNQLYVTSPETSSIGVRELAWKSEIPTGVMVESACEYNAVNEISGYAGSAIAQYGAEKQWLVHDDTLVHISNSAQYALGVNVSALQRLMGIDETVLWSGDAYTGSTAINLSEPTTAFTKIQFWNKTEQLYELGSNFPNGYAYLRYAPYELPGASACKILDVSLGVNTSNYMNLTYQFNKVIGPIHYATSTANKGVNYYYNVGDNDSHIVKIIGIGRKQ